MDFEQVLTLRQTTRKYTDQKVSDSDLEKILQAAQTAPLAAGDDKTTHLTLVKDPVLMEEIRNACMLTSRKTGQKIDALYGAQAMIFVSATDISEDHIEYCNTGGHCSWTGKHLYLGLSEKASEKRRSYEKALSSPGI